MLICCITSGQLETPNSHPSGSLGQTRYNMSFMTEHRVFKYDRWGKLDKNYDHYFHGKMLGKLNEEVSAW